MGAVARVQRAGHLAAGYLLPAVHIRVAVGDAELDGHRQRGVRAEIVFASANGEGGGVQGKCAHDGSG
ncbi:hypothetical protein D3C78_1839520 [compost metagenome]